MQAPFLAQSISHQAQAHWHHYVGGTGGQQQGPIPARRAPRKTGLPQLKYLYHFRKSQCRAHAYHPATPLPALRQNQDNRLTHWQLAPDPALYSLKASNAPPPVRAAHTRRDQRRGKSHLNALVVNALLASRQSQLIPLQKPAHPAHAPRHVNGRKVFRITFFRHAIQRKIQPDCCRTKADRGTRLA